MTAYGTPIVDAKEQTLLALNALLTARIGEVQATPTANTILARLKAINDTLSGGVGVTGLLTDVQLRATPVPVSVGGILLVGADDPTPYPIVFGAPSNGNQTVLAATAAVGQRNVVALDDYGALAVRIAGLSGALANVSKHISDGQATGNYHLEVRSYGMLVNSAGSTDRARIGQQTDALSAAVVVSNEQYIPNVLPFDVNLLTVMDFSRDSFAAGPAYRPIAAAMQTAAVANGNGTALNVAGYAVALISVLSSVAMSGGTTVYWEASVDDTTWVAIAAHTIGTNGSLATATTADGAYRIQTAGLKSIRARISGYSAGTVTITGYVSPTASAATTVALAAGSAVIGSVTVTGVATSAKQDNLITLMAAGLPAALGAGGGLKVDGSGTALAVSGTFWPASQPVAGDVDAGSTDSGKPVKVAGKYVAAGVTLADGQRGDMLLDSKSKLLVSISGFNGLSTTGAAIASDISDQQTAGNNGLQVASRSGLFDGTKWDRERNNVAAILLASAARTTTQTSGTIVNYNHSRLTWVFNVTSIGTGSITPSLQIVDANGVVTTIWTAAAPIIANGTYVYSFVPGVTTVGSFTEALPSGIPARNFKLVVTADNANPATYSSAYDLGL